MEIFAHFVHIICVCLHTYVLICAHICDALHSNVLRQLSILLVLFTIFYETPRPLRLSVCDYSYFSFCLSLALVCLVFVLFFIFVW